MVAADAPIHHRGGVVLFERESRRFAVEAYLQHGPHFISFNLVKRGRHWQVFCCDLALNDASNLEHVMIAIGQHL